MPLLRRAYAYWRELEQLTGETLLLTSGILEMGMPGSRLVAGTLKASEQYGLDHEVLSPREVQRRYPAIELPQDYSSVWQPDAGILRSDAINALHIRHAIAQGAQVVTNARVLAIEPRAGVVRLVWTTGAPSKPDRWSSARGRGRAIWCHP